MNAKVLEDVKFAAKNLVEANGLSANGKVPSLEDTIRGILNATTPARKAHATRKLTSYAVNHAKSIGSTPARVIAGVCAAVTKRLQKKSVVKSDKNPISLADLTKQIVMLHKKLELLVKAAN